MNLQGIHNVLILKLVLQKRINGQYFKVQNTILSKKIIVAFPTIIVYEDFHNIHQQTATTLITV